MLAMLYGKFGENNKYHIKEHAKLLFYMPLRLRVRVFGKIQIRTFESKNGFYVFLGKSQNGSWIHKIHTVGGFFRSNLNQDF